MKNVLRVWVTVVVWVLVSCGGPTPTPLLSPSPVSPFNSPLSIKPSALSPKFRLDPYTSGAAEVSGQGPIGFTLVIIDVTYGAKELGRGQADGQGNFRIAVSQPLQPGHLIGLTVDLSPDQVNDPVLNQQLFEISGPGYRFVPNLVTVFDSYEIH